MRTLFGKPIRNCTTESFYPEKITIEDFEKVIVGHFYGYAENMKRLNQDKEKFIEEWVEQYLAWLEIEEE